MTTHVSTATTPPGSAPGSTPSPRRARSMTLAILAAGAVLGLLLSLFLGPRTTLGSDRIGDSVLAADVEAVIADRGGLGALSVGRLSDGTVTYAGLGSTGDGAPTSQTPYELGSIAKAFTGMLLADAVDRGEVELSDPVGSHLPELAGTPAGDSTLQQLATHTSGLPGLPPAAVSRLPRLLLNQDPDADWTTARVLDEARQTPAGHRGTYVYSNLGMSLLGHALARAAGVDSWQQLAQQRLLDPLGMTSTRFLAGHEPEPVGLAQPHRTSGWPAHTWTSEGYAPAGAGTRTTAEDMMKFARAVVEGTAPGLAATKPTIEVSDRVRIGLAWHTLNSDGGELVWHNGGTGGSQTMLAIDLRTKEAVLVLNNTSRDVDDIAVDVLINGRPDVTITPSTMSAPIDGLVVLAAALLCVGSLVARALRSRDRVHVFTGLAEGAIGVALALIHGPWSWLPSWGFGVVAGVAVAATGLAVHRLPGLPTWPERRPVLAMIGLGFGLVILVLVVLTG